MLTEIKRPEVGPNADALTSLTRGRGPRRGNLEDLLKYWRPIMKKPGGFRRCVVILMDKPQFGGKPQRICAWLHHEITGKWPNEGKGKRGRGRGGKRRSRSVRRVRSAARRAKSDVLTPETFEISPLSLAIRESRDFGGVLVQPIAGRQSAVELKAAMFSTYSSRVVVVSGDVDEKRVGVVGSNTAIGQAVQAAGSIILPGDISDFRSPIRSQIYETLTPGGGGGRRRPSARRLIRGTGRQARNKFRCPPGYQKGGTFTNSQFSTCGAQILGIPGKGVGSPSSGAQRALAALARDASLVREIGDLRSNRNPYDIIRAAQIPVAPKKGSPTLRQTSINNVLSRSDEADFSIRAVRRDGVILEPVVSLQALGKLDEFDDLADGTLVDTYKNGQIGKDLVPAFSTGLRDVYVSIPEAGAVKISRVGGELSPTEVDSLRRTFPTSIRRAANLPDPSAAIRDYADRSDGRFTVEFGELKNNRFEIANSKNELIRVQTAGGKTLTVPQWVYETFLSRSAPRRAKDAPVYEIVSEQKTINPFLIAGKSVPLSVVPLSSKQAEIDFRAMYFSQMLDSDGVKVRRPRGPRGGRTRAIFDPNLNRYRCPPGTRYGGRISDKFGRNCGYSLPRQIVNALVDFGVRIEDRLDRRGRRRRGVDTQPGDRGGVNANVRADLDDIFQRLDNIEKELGLAFDKVEDRRPGRVGPTIGERRARQDLTDREKELLEGNDLAEAIEDLGRIIDGPEFDDASNEELREAFRRVEKAANLEAGRLTETPPRSPEQRGMAQRILDAIARILDRLADRLDGGDRARGRDRDRDVAPAPRGRDGGGRPRAPRDRDRDRDVLPRAPRRPGDPPTDEERREDRRRVRELSDDELLRAYQSIEDRFDGDVRRGEYKRLLEAEIRRRGLDPNQPVDRGDLFPRRDDRDAPEPPENVLDRLQQRAEEFDKRFGGRTGDFVQDLSDSELDDFINALEENADDLGEEGRDMLGRLRFERNRRRRDDNGVLSVLNDMQAQQEDFDKRFGGRTLRWVEQVGDEDLDRFIDALERADADLIGEEGAEMLRNLIAERDRRNRPPKSGDDILREISDRAEAYDLRYGGRTGDFVSDLDDAELNRFIDGLRRFDMGDEGREMLDRLVNERNLRKAAPAPHRRRVEDVNVGRRALNRNRRQNIEEFDDLSPENRVNLIHQAGVEFDELAEEWRVALGADDLNGFSEADMRDFVARKIKNNDPDARLWRRRYNDFLELNELNRKLDAAQNDEDVDNALNDHVGRLAAARRNSIVNARGANAADRPNRNDGRDDRGGAVPPPNNIDDLIEEVNNVVGANMVENYDDAELNDRLDMLDAEYRRYGADIDGPPPRRLAQARDGLRRERNRRDLDNMASAVGGDESPDDPDRLDRFSDAELRNLIEAGDDLPFNLQRISDDDLDRLDRITGDMAIENRNAANLRNVRAIAQEYNALQGGNRREDRLGDLTPEAEVLGTSLQQRVDIINGWNPSDFDRLGDIGNGQLLDSVYDELNGEVRRIIDRDGIRAVPADLRAALNKVSENRERRRRERDFQVNRPIADRDDDALNRHLQDLLRLEAAVPEDLVGDIQSQINELQSEIDRRNNIQRSVDSGVANVPSANPGLLRSVFNLERIRRKSLRRQQANMDKQARRFWGDERPFDLGVGRTKRAKRAKWASMSTEERETYVKNMFLHGKEVDLDTFESNGQTYQKSFEMDVNSINFGADGLPRYVSGDGILRVRDSDGNIVAEQRFRGYPAGGFGRSFTDTTVHHSSFGVKGPVRLPDGFTDENGQPMRQVYFNTGGGAAAAFNGNAFAFYKGLGYSYAQVDQSAGDGQAAWAVGRFRAPDATIRELNKPSGSIKRMMDDYDGYKEAIRNGQRPTQVQIGARMMIGDDERRARVQVLYDAAQRRTTNISDLPEHADYHEAVKPENGRNSAFYNFLRTGSPIGRGMDDEERDRLIEEVNREAGTEVVNAAWFDTAEFTMPSSERNPGGKQSLTNLVLPGENNPDLVTPPPPRPDTPEPSPNTPDRRQPFQSPIRTNPIRGNLGAGSVDGIPNKVAVEGSPLNRQSLADDHVRNGGSLAEVPDDYLIAAIRNNAGDGERFEQFGVARGINGDGTFFFKDRTTGATLGVKYAFGRGAFQNEAFNEVLGAEVARRMGFHQGNFRFGGPRGRDAFDGTQPIVFEAHQDYFGDGVVNAASMPGDQPFARAKTEDRVRMMLLDAVLLSPDRHEQNYMVATDGNGQLRILPIDHGAHAGNSFGADRALNMDPLEAIQNYIAGTEYGWRNEENYGGRDNFRRLADLSLDEITAEVTAWQESYPDDPAELQGMIDGLLDAAPGGIVGRAEYEPYMRKLVERFKWIRETDPAEVAAAIRGVPATQPPSAVASNTPSGPRRPTPSNVGF